MNKLNELHPDLRKVILAVNSVFPCRIICGYRGKEEQDRAFAEGKSKLKYPESKHNKAVKVSGENVEIPCSDAMDVVPLPVDFKDTNRIRYFAGFVMGVAEMLNRDLPVEQRIELRWGGDWDGDKDLNDQTFNDLVHIERVNL